MISDWEILKIEYFATVIGGGTPSKKIPEYFGDEIPWITPRDLAGYEFRYISKGETSITELGLKKSSAKLLPKGTVLFSSRAPIGYVAIAENPLATNQGFRSLICNPEKAYHEYIYYTLKYHKKAIENIASGATFKEVSGSVLREFKIPLPPLLTQKKIASILSAYDDLIENNIRRIQILEEMAQRIYREWFVYFHCPGHERQKLVQSELGPIPEGWKVRSVSDLYSIKSGFAFNSAHMTYSGDYGIVKIKNIQSDSVDLNHFQYIKSNLVDDRAWKFKLEAGDLLIAMTGAQIGKVGIMPKSKSDFLLNQRVGKFFPNEGFSTNNQFIFQISKSDNFQRTIYNFSQGAAQPNISGQDIGSIKILLPPIKLIEEFEDFCDPIRNEILLLDFHNSNLRQTRDLLLPKLISGKIDVSELDIDIGEKYESLQ